MLLVYIPIKSFSEKVKEKWFFIMLNNWIILGAGATVSVAEEMAARDALRRLFETDEQRAPIPFHRLYKSGLLIEK